MPRHLFVQSSSHSPTYAHHTYIRLHSGPNVAVFLLCIPVSPLNTELFGDAIMRPPPRALGRSVVRAPNRREAACLPSLTSCTP